MHVAQHEQADRCYLVFVTLVSLRPLDITSGQELAGFALAGPSGTKNFKCLGLAREGALSPVAGHARREP